MNLNVWVVVIVWYHNEYVPTERPNVICELARILPIVVLRGATMFRLMLHKCVNITDMFGKDDACYPSNIEIPTKVKKCYM